MGADLEVAVFDGIGQLQFSFYAYEPSFRGGVNVAAGPVLTATQATDNIVTGAGPGGGPVVGIWAPRERTSAYSTPTTRTSGAG